MNRGQDGLHLLAAIVNKTGFVPLAARNPRATMAAVPIEQLLQEDPAYLVHGRTDGHLRGLQIHRGGRSFILAQDDIDEAAYFVRHLLLKERREVFFSAVRPAVSSGAGRASQMVSFTAIN